MRSVCGAMTTALMARISLRGGPDGPPETNFQACHCRKVKAWVTAHRPVLGSRRRSAVRASSWPGPGACTPRRPGGDGATQDASAATGPSRTRPAARSGERRPDARWPGTAARCRRPARARPSTGSATSVSGQLCRKCSAGARRWPFGRRWSRPGHLSMRTTCAASCAPAGRRCRNAWTSRSRTGRLTLPPRIGRHRLAPRLQDRSASRGECGQGRKVGLYRCPCGLTPVVPAHIAAIHIGMCMTRWDRFEP